MIFDLGYPALALALGIAVGGIFFRSRGHVVGGPTS